VTATIVQSNAGGSTSNPMTATLPNPTATGNTLFVGIACYFTLSATPASFALDKSISSGGSNTGTGLYRKQTSAGEQAWLFDSTNGAIVTWCAMEVSGLLSSGTLDLTASQAVTGAGTTAVRTGTTGVTNQADELLVGLWGALTPSGPDNTFVSYTDSFVEVGQRIFNLGSSKIDVALATRVVSATAAYGCVATSTVSSSFSVGLLCTYKIAPVTPTKFIRVSAREPNMSISGRQTPTLATGEESGTPP
jgi:hypothetical protein